MSSLLLNRPVPPDPFPSVKPEVFIVLFVPASAPADNVPLPVSERLCPPTVPEIVRALDEAVADAS